MDEEKENVRKDLEIVKKIATWTSKNRKAQYLSRKEKGKKSLGGNNNGLDTTKGRIGELEENSAKEMIKSEAHMKKKIKKMNTALTCEIYQAI